MNNKIVKKLFGRIPYIVNEDADLPIEIAEDAIEEFMHEYNLNYAKIASVANDMRFGTCNLHLDLRNCEIPTSNVWIKNEYNHFDGIELTFSEFESMIEKIDSNFIERELQEQGNLDLLQAFKAMVGCYNGEIFNSLDENSFDYNAPDSRFAPYRQIIIDNQRKIFELSHKYNLDPMPLFKSLDFDIKKNAGNLIKMTTEELGMSYKELGEAIGYSESNLNKVASTGNISEPLKKAIELYLETLELKKELEKSNQIKATLKEWLK